MRVLVDTHILLWDILGDARSSRKAKDILSSDELVFSLASLWEIAVKIKIGKLKLIGSSVAYIRDEMMEYGMELLPIRYEHIRQLESLPHHPTHKDPFDRLLIAQSIAEALPVLTEDKVFKQYGAKVIW